MNNLNKWISILKNKKNIPLIFIHAPKCALKTWMISKYICNGFLY